MGLIIVCHRVVWVWWADACNMLDPLLWGAGSAQEGPALMVRIPQRALVDVCVAISVLKMKRKKSNILVYYALLFQER